ncbi:hypothetical protein [Streptomyces tremellae]|uniref:Uncharacterized protein n=1 Tax=Streptomyces tremellae TaxID=1124239 RepID=A0ABP7EQR3_9ACTN
MPGVSSYSAGGRRNVTQEEIPLWGNTTCSPHAGNPAGRQRVLDLMVVEYYPLPGLDAEGLLRTGAGLRAQLDHPEHHVAPRLVRAGEDWAAHGEPGRAPGDTGG